MDTKYRLMEDHTLKNLREALQHSPDNIPLRLLIADRLLTLNRLEEAEEEFTAILKNSGDGKAKIGLAKVFFKKGEFSTCIVILEEVIGGGNQDTEILTLYAKGLLKENEINKAVETYQRALALDPKFFDEELDTQLKLRNHALVEESDEEIDDRFLEKPALNFSDVGGMDAVKKEIELKIIKPLQHPELYKAYGKKTGGGILLYGPPGCGKTFLAKATAGQIKARFVNVSLNEILDIWVGGSEKNLHEIFELARAHTPCVLFIDEIDALGASRSDMKQSSGRHLINQFLQELDGVATSNEGVLVMGATNTPWSLDPAFRRPGRFDRIIFVPPPDEISRESILRLKLKNKPAEAIDFSMLSKKLVNYSGADIDALIDLAIEAKLESAFADGVPKPITTHDLLNAIQKHKPCTQEWFMTAKNFAVFANESGLYDDILNYLKLKK